MSFYGQIIQQIAGALQRLRVGANVTQGSEITLNGDDHIEIKLKDEAITFSHTLTQEQDETINIVTTIDNNNLAVKSAVINQAGHIASIDPTTTAISIPKLTIEDEEQNGNIIFSYK